MAGRKTQAGKPKTGDWQHIVERGGRLYLRLRVPVDVLAHFDGKPHIERTLGTSDIVAARKVRTRLLADWEAAFEAARGLPPPEAYRSVLERYYLTGPATPEQIRRLKSALRLEAELAAKADEEYEERLEQQYQSARAWVDSLSEDALDALRNHALYGHRVPALTGQASRPIAEFAVASVIAPDEALREIEKVEGINVMPEQQPDTGHTIWAAWDIYREEKSPKEKTAHEWRRSLELFEEAMGLEENPPRRVEEITRDHVRAYARFIRARPSGRGGTVAEDTVNKRLAALRSVLEVAARNDWIIKNPASGFIRRDRKAVTNRKRLPLLVAEIESVQSGIDRSSDDLWIWNLLRFTGARLGEIVQLQREDVKRHPNGTWYIRIHDEGERQLKNAASIRNVPLHAAVADGFCEWARQRPAGPLWPDCWRDFPLTDGSTTKRTPWPDPVSKRLNRRIRTAGISDSRKTLHSLRHSFKDALRHVTHDEELRDAILGHTGAAMVGRDYGDGHFLSKLAKAINKVDPAEIRRLQEMDANPWQVEEQDDEAECGVEAEDEVV